MRGQVVRGVGGRRDEYRPITSVLSADARPRSVAAALAAAGFRDTYVADLDAIAGAQPAWRTYGELIDCGLAPWIDAGLRTADEAQALADFRHAGQSLAGIIAGLESLESPAALHEMCRRLGSRLIFSLDLKRGLPLSGSAAWQGLDPRQIALVALRAGVRRMIVLDLARVGMADGVGTQPLCRTLRAVATDLEIVGGGGVRSLDDLRNLAAAGCDAALVASALHDGRLTHEECLALR